MHINRRQYFAGSAAIAALVVAPLKAAVTAASAIRKTPLHLVHPELRAALPMIDKMGNSQPPLTLANLPKLRAPNPLFSHKPADDVPFERRVIPVGKPHPDVAIYIINAKPGTSRPAILHTHGGGYVLGTAEMAIYDLQQLCKTLDCVAVSVDYRLAPETTYAGSIEDNYAGLKWLHANAGSIGADPTKIAVMGESAGGGHAALLAITARDRGEVPVCFQCLIYPMLDDRTGTSRPVPLHGGIISGIRRKTVSAGRAFWVLKREGRPHRGTPSPPASPI